MEYWSSGASSIVDFRLQIDEWLQPRLNLKSSIENRKSRDSNTPKQLTIFMDKAAVFDPAQRTRFSMIK